jgi:hypothetical protein
MSKYYLSVGAMFKNESHSIDEWIRHYLHHGVDHFYLINDSSTDNSREIIKPYIDKGLITLFEPDEPYYLGRQRNMYNRYILPLIKETKWLLMIDLDEYVWSTMDINMCNILRVCEDLGQIQIRQTIFGSNGHIKQPKFIVPSFTKRRADNEQDRKLKYFVNSSHDFSSLNLHYADFKDHPEYITDRNKCMLINSEYFIMNHYCCQSLEFWNDVKCTRGDGDHYLVRTIKHFKENDINETDDFDLYKQNEILYKNV